MINATDLSAINPRQPYHMYTDASKDRVGATLAQGCAHGKHKGHLRPIAFMSRKMQFAETPYPIREQERLAIVLALKQWCDLLRGPQQVHVNTDHQKPSLSQNVSSTADTRTSTLVLVPGGIQPHIVLCTGS